MLTIKNAAPTKSTEEHDLSEQGRITWLLSLDDDGKLLVANVACPLSNVPASLEAKDWTRYEGLLHTDHAVREEFFFDRDVAPTTSKPYLMDFTYLYDRKQPDFNEFALGKPFSEDEVFLEIGRPEDWTHRAGRSASSRTDSAAATVLEQLLACRQWEILPGLTDDAS